VTFFSDLDEFRASNDAITPLIGSVFVKFFTMRRAVHAAWHRWGKVTVHVAVWPRGVQIGCSISGVYGARPGQGGDPQTTALCGTRSNLAGRRTGLVPDPKSWCTGISRFVKSLIEKPLGLSVVCAMLAANWPDTTEFVRGTTPETDDAGLCPLCCGFHRLALFRA
jgi:hypothetical protein